MTLSQMRSVAAFWSPEQYRPKSPKRPELQTRASQSPEKSWIPVSTTSVPQVETFSSRPLPTTVYQTGRVRLLWLHAKSDTVALMVVPARGGTLICNSVASVQNMSWMVAPREEQKPPEPLPAFMSKPLASPRCGPVPNLHS
jgi:hypothetical protein